MAAISVSTHLPGSESFSQSFTVRQQWGAESSGRPSEANHNITICNDGQGMSINVHSHARGAQVLHQSMQVSSNGLCQTFEFSVKSVPKRSTCPPRIRPDSRPPSKKGSKKFGTTRLFKPDANTTPTTTATSPVNSANQRPANPVSSSKTTTAMPDIDSIPAIASSGRQHLHHLFENALVYLSQSPLTASNRRKGIDTLFDLLNEAKLANHPVLHAMTHTAVAVNTPFDERNGCKYMLDHLEKAQDIALSVLGDGHGYRKEEAACQGCMYARCQREAGKETGEEDASGCNSLARLSRVIESECLRVARFNRGEFDHLLV